MKRAPFFSVEQHAAISLILGDTRGMLLELLASASPRYGIGHPFVTRIRRAQRAIDSLRDMASTQAEIDQRGAA